MKILTGIDLPFSWDKGGSLIVCNDLYSKLQETNTVKFLTCKPQTSLQWSTIKDVVFLNSKKTNDTSEFNNYVSELIEEIKSIYEEFKPDIIHIQHLNFGLSLALSRLPKKTPKIAFCHGTDILYASNSDFFLNVFLAIENSVNQVILPSNSILKNFETISKNKLVPRKIINWGVPIKEIQQNAFSYKNSSAKFKILTVARASPEKGLNMVLELSNLLLDEEFELTLITNLDNYYFENLPNLKVINYVNRSILWQMFGQFDLLIIPSNILEAFCLVAVEAQAAGLPILYSKIECLEEIIGDSGVGYTCNDLADLYANLLFLAKNPFELEKLTALGFNNAKRYDLPQFIEKIKKLT